jgi:hypothetical protein
MKRLFIAILMFCFTQVFYSEEVKTGIYLVNMGAFNITDGTTNVDFYISFRTSSKERKLPDIDFEFMNGSQSTCYIVDEFGYKRVYRVKATIMVPVNLRAFPFEKHSIQIILEDKSLPLNDLVFIPDDGLSGLDKSVFIPGYTIKNWKITNNEHYYSVFQEQYSQIVYTINIEKPILNAFLKTLLPAICMVIVVLSSFLIKDDMENRIATITSGLLGVIMFHVSVAGQLPPIGYLTFADKIFLISYLVIIFSLAINLITMKVIKNNHEIAEKVYSKTRFNILFLYLIVIFFYCFLTMK